MGTMMLAAPACSGTVPKALWGQRDLQALGLSCQAQAIAPSPLR